MKKIIFISMIMLLLFGITGCNKEDKKTENGATLSDDGRYYGGYESAEMGETLTNSFFSYEVMEAKIYDEYTFGKDTYAPRDGEVFIVCKIKITNVYGEELPMSIGDIKMYTDKDTETYYYGYGDTDIGDAEFFTDKFQLTKDESITKYILYSVPETEKYSIKYQEKWEDNFVGNTYEIFFIPEDTRKE